MSEAEDKSRGVLLAIESSCDETAVAVVDRSRQVLANIVASQDQLHARWGGVVPEVASRAHVERIIPCLQDALSRSGCSLSDVEAIGVVTQPGLVGSLLVGLTAAKTLAWLLEKPLVAVNHIEAHLFACRWAAETEPFPAVGLVVSGGHTNLYDCRSTLEFELLGTTTDDAAGEAFDKAAAVLGLPYPGGPSLSRVAEQGNPKAIQFPRTFLNNDRLEFSFSGLKTALLYAAEGQPGSHTSVPRFFRHESPTSLPVFRRPLSMCWLASANWRSAPPGERLSAWEEESLPMRAFASDSRP